MPRRYFRLTDDVHVPERWDLNDPADLQGRVVDERWIFAAGNPVSVAERLQIPIYVPGRAIDFSLAGSGPTPVVHARAASIFTRLAPDDVQLIPVEIAGQLDPYFILVATKLIRCIDDAASEEVRYFGPEDGHPDKIGEYRVVSGMRIDLSPVGEARVFRTWGWPLALIVSEEIKMALEQAGITGTKFKEVTGPPRRRSGSSVS
ncbi:hypothetical protein D7V97_18010 [Corallococcus sp. CA053C]|uniref:imm11 family protein n=1 Tax=Corallococcus sp. CA053C TaxID=2316732 RepID=UPI000EA0B8A2|nr:DUF1629 domain-containing protein [Corallococcus sp. CA053C]RKH08960.1 hypothetical protein D7V97_18010 [Corallococcus sp. CA053C]